MEASEKSPKNTQSVNNYDTLHDLHHQAAEILAARQNNFSSRLSFLQTRTSVLEEKFFQLESRQSRIEKFLRDMKSFDDKSP